jgi:hypothetical protein
MTQNEEAKISKELEKMTYEELLAFIPVIESLGKAKKAGMLFESSENVQ